MPKKEAYLHLPQLEVYLTLIATISSLERKGATMPYTAINGNMFSFLDKDGNLGLRLPEKERASFLKKYASKNCEAYGVMLKEYVLVPDNLFKNMKVMKAYFKMSYAYALTLKTK